MLQTVITLAIYAAVGYGLFKASQKDKYRWIFWSIANLIQGLAVSWLLVQCFFWFSLNWPFWIVAILLATDWYFKMSTLNEVGGLKKLTWFYVVLFSDAAGWIFYKIQKVF